MNIFELIYDIFIAINLFLVIHSVYMGIILKDIVFFGYTIAFLILAIVYIIFRNKIKCEEILKN